MPPTLEGRVAVVTGASKGIGAGIATAMGAAGAAVVVNYSRDRAGAEQVVSAITDAGGRALALQANIGDAAEVERLFTEGAAAFGAIDVIVNNAGLFSFAQLDETSDEQLQEMISANLLGPIYVCREALKHFPAMGGAIINIGSMSSVRYSAGSTAYTATKAAMTGVTGVLAVELAPRNIRVNQINPGAVDTEGARAIGAMSDESRARHIGRTPLGRVGTPADIAAMAVFLASEDAGWITGEVIAVSGGLR
jgi:3-oxoacyl-[acyl-carrier protein] reductase